MITVKVAKAVPARAAVVVRLVTAESLAGSGVPETVLERLAFTAEAGASLATSTETVEWLTLVGVGAAADLTAAGVRRAAAIAVRAVATHPSAVIDLSLLEAAGAESPSADSLGQAAVEGAHLGAYRFDRYKTEEKPS